MQTTLVGTPDFGDAAVMVEACYTELLRAGFVKEADSIRGAELYSMSGVRTALETLQRINVSDESVNSAVRYAVAVLRTLGTPRRELAAVG